jgi:hypothetical protein
MRVVGGEMRLFLKEWNFYAMRGPNRDGLLPFRVPYVFIRFLHTVLCRYGGTCDTV